MSQSNLDTTRSNSPLNYFSNRALDYAKYRPSYPIAAIDLILEGLRSPSQLACADIGAGTGISSRLLAVAGGEGASDRAKRPNETSSRSSSIRRVSRHDSRSDWFS